MNKGVNAKYGIDLDCSPIYENSFKHVAFYGHMGLKS